MSLTKDNSKLHGFEPTIHTLVLRVRDLQLTRGWWAGAGMLGELDSPKPVSYVLRGIATTGADTIVVIGSEESEDKTRKLEFSLIGRTREDRAKEWEALKRFGDRLDGTSEDPSDTEQANLVQFLRNVNEGFEKEPPTVFVLRHKPDREHREVAPWSVSCETLPETLDAIVADIHVGRCTEIECSVELAPTLSDEWYAPPSAPAKLGLLRQSKYDDGSCHGWVKSLRWATAGSLPPESDSRYYWLGIDKPRNEDSGDEEIIPSSRQSAAVAAVLQPSSTSDEAMAAVAALATATKRGFWALFILILLIALFR